MADTSVQGIGDLMSSYLKTDYPSSIAKAKSSKAVNGDSQSFDDVIASGFSAILNNFPANQVTEANRTSDLMSKISVSTDYSRTNTVRVNDNVRNLQTKATESALEDAVHDAGSEMVTKISEVLGVSEETVASSMENLSLTESDLLDAENLSTLTMEITGTTEDELLTNDALYQDLQQLMDTMSELNAALLDRFDLTDFELTTAIANLSAGLNMDLIETAFVNPEMEMDNPFFGRVDAPAASPKVSVNVEEEGDMVMQEEELMQQNAPQNLRTSVEETSAQGEQNENGASRREAREDERVEFTNAFDSVANRLNETVQDTFVNQLNEEAVPQPTVDPADIMRQITDFMRVEVKPDVTSMELALHPQSLGHITVQVAEAADGNLTARFLTQNEAVKEALEQQMVQLQQRFEEQGLKVTEISVTVESHAFEQNLQQGADPNPEGNAQNAPRTARPRRITLDDDDITVEGVEMTQAEILAADMMARSGNTLDYMA